MHPQELFTVVQESLLLSTTPEEINAVLNEQLGYQPSRAKTRRSLEKAYLHPEVQHALANLSQILARATVDEYLQ
jgi:hypothetical protein